MEKKKVTIADVASLANVSISSVSNVLNGRSKRMRSSTEERILQAIQELEYTPNFAARQLKTGHSPIIGLIVPSVANLYFGAFARCVEEVALENGYQVLLGNSDRDVAREKRYAEELLTYGVTGIIIGSSLKKLTHLYDVINKGMHIVAFDRRPQADDKFTIDSFGVDNEQTMKLITKHLLALGHRRIGFISGPIQTVSRVARRDGYCSALSEAGIEYDPQLVWEGASASFGDDATIQIGRQGSQALLSYLNPPTAIIALNDMYAFGAYAGARDLGLNIPNDVSITGVDDIALADVIDPPLTTVQQPIAEIARLAVEKVIARIQGDCREAPECRTLAPKLIVRGSTAPAR